MTGLNWTSYRIAQNILKIKYANLESLNHKDVLLFLEEFLSNGESYTPSRSMYQVAKKNTHGESNRVFRKFVEYCLYRNIANYDSMILISSEKGTGKSSFAMMLAYEWCKLIGIKFDPNRHFAYTNQQVTDKIRNLNSFEPLVCDEAINFATSEQWAKTENKELKKILGQVRTKHLFYILCFPLKIMKLDKIYLESYVNYWIDLFARGTGALYVKDKNPYYDAWRMKEFQRLGNYNEFTPVSNVHNILAKHPNFWYVIRAPKPPDALYNKYLKVREFNVYDDQNVLLSTTKEDLIRAVLLVTLKEILQRDSTLSIKRLLLHLENIYQMKIEKNLFEYIMKDAAMLATKIKEENLGKLIK